MPAADQITAAFIPGVSVIIADLTSAARCDRSTIRNLLKAHRKATARGGQVRFAIRPDDLGSQQGKPQMTSDVDWSEVREQVVASLWTTVAVQSHPVR